MTPKTSHYCRQCEEQLPMKAGPTRGDLTCPRCGTVYEHAAFGGM